MRTARIAVLVVALLAATAGAAWSAFVATTSNDGNTFAAAGAFSGYSDEVLTDGPAGYWRLGETSGTSAADATGAGNNGTYTNGVTLGEAGALLEDTNSASSFDGVNDAVSVPDAAALDLADGPFTLEAWIKRGSTTTDDDILQKGTNAYRFYIAASGKLALRKQGVADVVQSTATITDTTSWHHVVATKNGAVARLYVDGGDVTGKITNQTLANTTSALLIGSAGIGSFDGSIDEAAVYPTALSAARVRAHHRAGRPYHGEVLLDDPTAYWRLGETAGNTTVAFDTKGTSHGVASSGAALGQAGGLISSTNTAAAFNGTNGWVEIPHSAVPALTGNFSIESWVKPNVVTGTQFLVNKDTTYYLYLAGSDILFGYRSGGAYLFARANGVVTTGAWQHLVGTYNGSTIAIYRNGVLVASAAFGGAVDVLGGNLYLGALSSTGSYFNGALDEVALYHSALGASRIQAHYEAGRPYRDEVLADAPVSYWRLGESGEAIQHRGSQGAARTTSGTTLAINKPAGVVQGDVLVAAIQESGGTGGSLSAPLGWSTPVLTRTLATTSKTYVYWKLAGASEPVSYTWTSTLSAEHSGGIVALANVDGTSPIDDSASQENAASLSVTCPSVTTTEPREWLLTFAVIGHGNTFTFPGSMSERFDVRTGTTSTDRATTGGTEALAAAGATGTRTVTDDNNGGGPAEANACISLAVRPDKKIYDYQHGNDGDYTSTGVTLSAAGALPVDDDDAVTFDGANGNASVPDSASLDLANGPFTLEAWIKRGGTTTDDDVLQKGTNGYRFYITATTGKLTLRKQAVADIVQSTTAILDTTTWHHVVATKSGATTKLYIDGADVTGTVTDQTLVDTSSALLIGGGGTGFFHGSIDELAVYDKVLTPSEVALHNAEGRG